jgi:hypothetical protein
VINSIHDFLNHEHLVCNSKIEKHVHEKDIDCKLHLLKKNDSFLTSITTEKKLIEFHSSITFTKYHYLKNHYQLSFSQRGPPSII